MRRLFPVAGSDDLSDVDLAALYAPPTGRHVRANFIVSTDGATTVDGVSGGLSGPADRQLFHVLRSLCDVVLVGSTTARRENYGGARSYDGHVPVVAVVSGSLDLDPGSRLFTETTMRPWVLTVSSAPADRRAALGEVAHVVDAGEDSVDVLAALDALAAAGLDRVLCEGGPHLLGDVVAASALDDLCLSVAPLLSGGGSASRLLAGLPLVPPVPLRLEHVLEESGTLFLRLSTVRP